MQNEMYSIRDRKSGLYQQPFTTVNVECAMRLVKQELQRPCMISTYPEDFQLYRVGIFDDTDGRIESTEVTFICELAALKAGDANE